MADLPGVLACSTLKECFRQQLMDGNVGVQNIYLKDSYDLIRSRTEKWTDHYMKPQMLRSQFEVLEEPTNALTMDISMSVDDIVQGVISRMLL
jgi:gluconokinase